MRRVGRTRPFRSSSGKVLPGSIAEIKNLDLGGVDQWVMIRGESLANPPLIMLSGGPGFSEAALFRHFNSPLETAFTVVYWDQRGSGKSYQRTLPRSSMTVGQFIVDLDKLVDAVLERTDSRRVAIFGHSWGSALGVLYAHRHPEKVAAYVGSGQIGDAAVGETASYNYALSEAARQHNEKALQELSAIGAPPYDHESLWIERTWLQRLEGRLGPKALFEMGRIFLEGPEFSLADMPNLLRGFRFSLEAMWQETSRINLIESAPVLEMPAFFFLGREDHWVPPEASLAYIDVLSAPAKTVVWFEQSGHEPFADEPEKFNASMIDLVRPVLA